jgi:hypothetical protein
MNSLLQAADLLGQLLDVCADVATIAHARPLIEEGRKVMALASATEGRLASGNPLDVSRSSVRREIAIALYI